MPATNRTRSLAVGLAALTVALVVSLAMLFISSEATTRVAANAAQLHWTNSTLGSVGLARAANAQAVFFAVDEAIGVASAEATALAVEEAKATLRAVEDAGDIPPLNATSDTDVLAALDSFTATASAVIAAVEDGNVELAAETHRDALEPVYVVLDDILVERRAVVEGLVEETETMAGRIATATRFLVTLLIPASALVLYRRIVKRQVREANLVMAAKLRAEQELSKAKDEFIAGLSHEFRTPLTSIFGFSEVLIDSGLVDPDASLELISLIHAESAELSRMVEDLLTAARLEAEALSISPSTVDPTDVVHSLLEPWRRAGQSFAVDLESAGVWADPLRIRQVLRNLISNAIKHGGDKIAIVGRVSDGAYQWSVIDDGPGVPDDIAGRLFEKFIHNGSRALLAGSVGLGLNIARSLAIAMGGELTYTRRGATTWFTVSVPLAVTAPHVLERGAA